MVKSKVRLSYLVIGVASILHIYLYCSGTNKHRKLNKQLYKSNIFSPVSLKHIKLNANFNKDNYLDVYKPKICQSLPVNRAKAEKLISEKDCSQHYITEITGGRLGNSICNFFSLFVLRHEFGPKVFWSKPTGKEMNHLFEEPYLNEFIPGANCDLVKKGIRKDILLRYTFTYLYESLRNGSLNIENIETPLVMENECPFPYFWPYRKELRNIFRLKPQLKIIVKLKLQKQLEKFNLLRDDVTIISVHVRKKGYDNYVRKRLDADTPGLKFYNKAFEYYSQKYPNAVFAVVSNDKSTDHRMFDKSEYKVIFPGSGKIGSPYVDFAILMEADHHIIGFGTYAIVSAFLGRGTIAYDAYSSRTTDYFLTKQLLCGNPKTYIPIDHEL